MRTAQMVADAIQVEADKQGLSINKLMDDSGMKWADFSHMRSRNSMPAADRLMRISQRLGVSVEYLLTGRDLLPAAVSVGNVTNSTGIGQINAPVTTNKDRELSKEASELLRIYDLLSVKGRQNLISAAFALEEQETGK